MGFFTDEPCTTALLRFAPISNSFRTLTHPFFPLSGKDPCRDVDVVPDGSNPGRNSVLDRLPLPFHPRGYSIQIMPISDDLNKRLQFARMPARNVNYITRGGASSKRELPRVGWMRRFKRGWWNTRQLEGREKKKRIFSGKCGWKYAFEIAANLMQACYREIRFDTKWMHRELLPDLWKDTEKYL